MGVQVIVVGSYNQDHVWHLPRMVRAGETLRGHGFSSGPGGKGFNQAVACVRQDVATAFVGARGADALGERAEQLAAAEGLQGAWQVDADHATGSACILVDEDGQNRIVVDLGANEHLRPDHIDAQAMFMAGAKVLLTQMETGIESVTRAMYKARSRGLLTLLNPAPVHPAASAECLRMAHVLLPNEAEFAELCGRFGDAAIDPDAVARMADQDLHTLARRLSDGHVVITLGAAGCFVSRGAPGHDGGAMYYRVPACAGTVRDTTGAGDAFCGALAAAAVRLAGQPFRAMVEYASQVAALAVERPGAALAMPRHADVAARFGAG